jgi:hypothetical protein
MTGGLAKPVEAAPAGQLGVQAAPEHDGRHAIAVVTADERLISFAPGSGVGAGDPVLAVTAPPAGPGWLGRGPRYSTRSLRTRTRICT